MVPECAEFMKPVRSEMQPPAQRVGNRLCLIMIVETGQVPPAGVTAKFDEASAHHNAEDEPPKEPDDEARRRAFGEGPSIKQGTEKDGQKPGLEKLDLPPIAIPVLPDI